MEQRRLGRTGLDVGVIGLGTEHLEQNRETLDEVLGLLADAGGNYIDLLYCHPESHHVRFWEAFEPAFGRRRDEFVVAAHWGNPGPGDLDECQRSLESVLKRIGGYAEIVMIDVIDEQRQWDDWGQRSVERLLPSKERGRIGHIAMSGHTVPVAESAIGGGCIDVIMFGINLLNHHDDAVSRLWQVCTDQGVGLVAMKPYYGGRLLRHEGKLTSITPVQCLSYVLEQPVATAVPGPRNAEELREALAYVEASDQQKDYQAALGGLHESFEGVCTYCNHCLPCLEGINIGQTLLRADFGEAGVTDQLRGWYAELDVKASACTECGICVDRCPFKVDVIARMQRAVELYE